MPEDTARPVTPTPHDGEGLAQRLIDQVAALQKRIDRADRRQRIERALADAQAVDVPSAADELEQEGGDNPDIAALVRTLKRSKPAFFAPGGPAPHASAAALPAADPPRVDQHLTVLREKAARGDRASLLLYLRARRSRE
ncbi:MAG TPA: hypothetical protein VEB22_01320 [Phycisphaerales bacterium]|nr:hypothetical protein [Phycisphaerales bacterium]